MPKFRVTVTDIEENEILYDKKCETNSVPGALFSAAIDSKRNPTEGE